MTLQDWKASATYFYVKCYRLFLLVDEHQEIMDLCIDETK